MSKKDKFKLLIACVVVGCISIRLGSMIGESICKEVYSLQPSTTAFVMYTDTCSCGYDKVEVEYSLVGDLGHSFCPNCESSYEFSLDASGNKITKGRMTDGTDY